MDLHALEGNVDLLWDEPDWGPLLLRMSEFARLIIHDRRGSGASTRNVPPPNLETRAADLLVVLGEIGSEAPVLGAGASMGAMHALFAATCKRSWATAAGGNSYSRTTRRCARHSLTGAARSTTRPATGSSQASW